MSRLSRASQAPQEFLVAFRQMLSNEHPVRGLAAYTAAWMNSAMKLVFVKGRWCEWHVFVVFRDWTGMFVAKAHNTDDIDPIWIDHIDHSHRSLFFGRSSIFDSLQFSFFMQRPSQTGGGEKSKKFYLYSWHVSVSGVPPAQVTTALVAYQVCVCVCVFWKHRKEALFTSAFDRNDQW